MNEKTDAFNQTLFNMCVQSFDHFFQDLHFMETKSLSQSKEVLDERKRLEVVVEGLQQRIRIGLAKIDECKQMQKELKEHEVVLNLNDNNKM